MAYELKDGQGSLFVNDKGGVETRPDRKGKIRFAGRDYWLSGWVKTTKDGEKWMSLQVGEEIKSAKTAAPAPPPARASSRNDYDF